MQWEQSLFSRLKDIKNHSFLNDGGKDDPLSKCYIMAYLASFFKLRNYVEIGVFKGNSLFSVAQAFKDNDGNVYGIDPYVDSKKYDSEEKFKKWVDKFKIIDFEAMYSQVLINIEVLQLSKVVEIIRKTSTEAAPYFKDIKIDMLHIHGNHDCESVQADINNYTPLIREGGIIVFDSLNKNSIKSCYDQYKNDYIILLETNNFGILMRNQKNLDSAFDISSKLKNLYTRLLEMENKTQGKRITVNVGVLAYNHEKYIVDCLNSIIIQKGDFNLNIIICEDKSTDGTAGIIAAYINNVAVGQNVSFEFLKGEENLGMVKNLKRLLEACSKSMYTALMDGDDYWADENKLQTHLEFMESHPQCSISFDDLIVKNGNKYFLYYIHQQIKGDIFTTQDIINMNFIGNISCCFYYSKYLSQLPNGIFEIFSGDWMLNIACSMFGEIGHIKKAMTIYRNHNQGIWNRMNNYDKNKTTIYLIDDYNKYLNYTYDEEFSRNRKVNAVKMGDKYLESYDLVIIDDVFPHPARESRYQEFLSYFEHFNSMKVLTTGTSVHLLGKKTVKELIIDFKRKIPEIGSKLERFSTFDNINCKLLYFVYLQNVASFLYIAESRGIPFVFSLYSGGGFALDDSSSDKALKRVTSSTCFKKVIVTEEAIYNYLIDKNFCKPEQIEFIFGVVTPLNKIEKGEHVNKKHYDVDKVKLDICFVDNKYTDYEQDKAYDVFIEVAKQLVKMHSNIHFHVVGDFDEKFIDISEIKNNITFYGTQFQDWFDGFYKDKDIILSPDITSRLYTGSFDGFPNARCIEAGLHKTAIFCTDPLVLNNSYFKDNKQIVIVNSTPSKIINKIEYYYNNPLDLKNICENGYKVIKDLYGFDNQIAPRIRLLEANIQ